ncbi:Transcription factor Pur-alpha 1 [Camellia lanceoleosa]|uniref:Transcription factor Pur-alpha 1 n=1 Tax=Camellia lanceoleosa TaxID=1840588 RepID=A0ACC0IFM5_9ERIC|nr:Transcription factor Pur-alpha 1 [Camellia lanceoleosa]
MAYRGRASELRVEQKIIIIKIDEESRGELVEITERNRARSFSVRIDLGGVFWVKEALIEAWKRFSEDVFFSKYRSHSAVFCLQRFNNKRGAFVELSRWTAGIKRSNVIIPVGVEGQGWLHTAALLGRIISGGSKGNVGVKTDRTGIRTSQPSGIYLPHMEKAITGEFRGHTRGATRGQYTGVNRGRSYA